MNRQSIFFTISVSFIISILLVIVSFLILITHDYKMKEGQLLDKYVPVMKMVNRQEKANFDEEFIKSLEEINYKFLWIKAK
jgi:two-component system, OmpR family, sensor kinase